MGISAQNIYGTDGSDSDPIAQAIANLNAVKEYEKEDERIVKTLLLAIESRHKSGDGKPAMGTQAALMLAIQVLLPQVIQTNGDKVGVQGAAQNVGSAVVSYTNEMAGDFSTLQTVGSNPPSQAQLQAAASDLIQKVNEVLGYLGVTSPGQPPPSLPTLSWVDGATQASAVSALDGFVNMFVSTSNPYGWNGMNVASDVSGWASGATSDSGSSGKSADVMLLQQASGHLSTAGSAFASSTSVQGSVLQNSVAVLGQILTAMSQLLQNTISLENSIVTSLKPS